MLRNMITVSALVLFAIAAEGAQLLRLNVDQQAGIYEVYVEMHVDAPVESVRAILTDYSNLDRLNASITSSQVIETAHEDGATRVLTRFENCVLFFCTDIQKVEDVTEDERGRIHLAMVPDSSNFRSGQASWEIQSTENGSLVIHHAKLEPDLWIPPWMGTEILKNSLRKEISESFDKLDCLARTDCEPDPAESFEDIWDDSWDA